MYADVEADEAIDLCEQFQHVDFSTLRKRSNAVPSPVPIVPIVSVSNVTIGASLGRIGISGMQVGYKSQCLVMFDDFDQCTYTCETTRQLRMHMKSMHNIRCFYASLVLVNCCTYCNSRRKARAVAVQHAMTALLIGICCVGRAGFAHEIVPPRFMLCHLCVSTSVRIPGSCTDMLSRILY